jgi:hypothetical protein
MSAPKDFYLSLGSSFSRPTTTLGEFRDASVTFLRKLQTIHPMLSEGLYLVGGNRKNSPVLAADLSNVESWILKKSWYSETPKAWFTELDTKNQPSWQSQCTTGFDFAVSNLRGGKADALEISISSGGVSIKLPPEIKPNFKTYAFSKKLLKLLVDHWKPEFAGVTNRALWSATMVRNSSEPLILGIDWLHYMDDPGVMGALPTDIEVEPFGPGGIFFSLAPEPPLDQASLDAMLPKALRIRDALLPGRWMTWRSSRLA